MINKSKLLLYASLLFGISLSLKASVITMNVNGTNYTSAFWSDVRNGSIPGLGTITDVSATPAGSLRNANGIFGTLGLSGPPAGTTAADAFPIPTSFAPGLPGQLGDQLFGGLDAGNNRTFNFSQPHGSLLLLFANLGISGNHLTLRLNGDAVTVPTANVLVPRCCSAASLQNIGGMLSIVLVFCR